MKYTFFFVIATMISIGSLDVCHAQYLGGGSGQTADKGTAPAVGDEFPHHIIAGIFSQSLKEKDFSQISIFLEMRFSVEETRTLFANVQLLSAFNAYETAFLGGGATVCLIGDKHGGLYLHGNIGALAHNERYEPLFAHSPTLASNIGATVYLQPFTNAPAFEFGFVYWQFRSGLPYSPTALRFGVVF